METNEKVYFIHKGGKENIKAVDCFVRSERELTKEECEKAYGIDYYMPDCQFVGRFLKNHPEYKYVGSTDSAHTHGYAMNLDGWKKVITPSLINIKFVGENKAEEIIRKIVKEHGDELSTKDNYWCAVLDGILEICNMRWDVVSMLQCEMDSEKNVEEVE